MIFFKDWDKKEELPTLNFEDGEIEIETHILNTQCGLCHHLQYTSSTWRDRFLCNVYERVLNENVGCGFGSSCKYFNFERLFSKKPANEKVRKWMERTNAPRYDTESINLMYKKIGDRVLRRIRWNERCRGLIN